MRNGRRLTEHEIEAINERHRSAKVRKMKYETEFTSDEVGVFDEHVGATWIEISRKQGGSVA